MKVRELIEELQRLHPELEATVYLEPSMFPDGVDLNELPGWYRIDKVQLDTSDHGMSAAIQLIEDPQ